MIVRALASPRTPDRSRTPGHPRALGHPRAIAGGSFLGGALIGAAGTRSVALVATGLSAVSAALLASGALLPPRPAPVALPVPALAAPAGADGSRHCPEWTVNEVDCADQADMTSYPLNCSDSASAGCTLLTVGEPLVTVSAMFDALLTSRRYVDCGYVSSSRCPRG